MMHRGLRQLRSELRDAELTRRIGTVVRLSGLAIVAQGPNVQVGELCAILLSGSQASANHAASKVAARHVSASPAGVNVGHVLAEVVGIESGQIILMPFGSVQALAAGNEVIALGGRAEFRVGEALLGRVIDAFGAPLDGLAVPVLLEARKLKAAPINPMRRPRIGTILETGCAVSMHCSPWGEGNASAFLPAVAWAKAPCSA
ncbi:V-type ATP synthase beta chain [Ralstonia syzygii]|uniref:hypothetical protein n=1 Tax=Ralstonia syzygii TaxID=28097 RepID=UPI0036F1F74A